jgi:hypothetical protein
VPVLRDMLGTEVPPNVETGETEEPGVIGVTVLAGMVGPVRLCEAPVVGELEYDELVSG